MPLPKSHIIEKDGKLRVSIEYIEWLEAERMKINNIDLANIEFYQNDNKMNIPLETINEFKLTGLNNINFVSLKYYD